MPCCLEQWRCSVGAFLFRISSMRFTYQVFKRPESFYNLFMNSVKACAFVFLLNCIHFQYGHINSYVIIISFLLLLSGDIHENPGPTPNSQNASISTTTSSSEDVNSTSTSGINIMHLNIRSIRNKIDFLQTFTDDIDILCLTETHLDPSIPNESIKLDNFSKILRKDRNMFGGGVAIYINENIPVIRRSDLEIGNDENIWIQYQLNNTIYIIGNIYRPQWVTCNSGIWDRLDYSLNLAFETTTNILLTGDINIDMLNTTNS